MDLAKRLLDYGFHAPTVYFPLTVHEVDDDRADRDREQGNARRLRRDAVPHHRGRRPTCCTNAPHTTPISRPDEVQAARQPVLSGRTVSAVCTSPPKSRRHPL